MKSHLSQRSWVCHWGRVTGPSAHGRMVSSVVWICEYPFRTMLSKPPSLDDCADCPLLAHRLVNERKPPQRERVDPLPTAI